MTRVGLDPNLVAGIRTVFQRMPAAPLAHLAILERDPSTLYDPDDLVIDLTKLADTLARLFADSGDVRRELNQARADLEAVRRVFGITDRLIAYADSVVTAKDPEVDEAADELVDRSADPLDADVDATIAGLVRHGFLVRTAPAEGPTGIRITEAGRQRLGDLRARADLR